MDLFSISFSSLVFLLFIHEHLLIKHIVKVYNDGIDVRHYDLTFHINCNSWTYGRNSSLQNLSTSEKKTKSILFGFLYIFSFNLKQLILWLPFIHFKQEHVLKIQF